MVFKNTQFDEEGDEVPIHNEHPIKSYLLQGTKENIKKLKESFEESMKTSIKTPVKEVDRLTIEYLRMHSEEKQKQVMDMVEKEYDVIFRKNMEGKLMVEGFQIISAWIKLLNEVKIDFSDIKCEYPPEWEDQKENWEVFEVRIVFSCLS